MVWGILSSLPHNAMHWAVMWYRLIRWDSVYEGNIHIRLRLFFVFLGPQTIYFLPTTDWPVLVAIGNQCPCVLLNVIRVKINEVIKMRAKQLSSWTIWCRTRLPILKPGRWPLHHTEQEAAAPSHQLKRKIGSRCYVSFVHSRCTVAEASRILYTFVSCTI